MPRDFELQIGKVAKVLNMRADTVVKKVGIDIFSGIVQRNPVKTGRSRAAWNIGIDKPVDLIIEPKGDEVLPPPSVAGGIRAMTGADGTKQKIYITNAVHYTPYLEGGSSKQAPAGMVLVTVEAVKAELDQVITQAVRDNPLTI